MVSVTKRNTPALRFDGFDGEWDHRELSQIGVRSTATNTDAALTETFTNSAQHGIISQLEYFDNAVSNPANISKYSVVEPDDFVYNPRISVTAPFGPINRNRLSRSGAMSPLYLVFKVFGVDHGFLEQFFKTGLWHDFMRLNGDVGARHDRFSIGDAKFMEMEILTPLLEEQRAIGELFADLDALIEQHRAKHANLQQTKTALLQRMFPQDGADEPELRLGGFANPWVLRHLGEFEITTGPFGSTLHAEDYVEHGTPIVTTEHFKSGLLPLTGQGVPQVSDDDRRRLKMYWLQTDDIVFSRVGSVDINARVTELQNGWLFSGRVLRVRPDATCESEFLHSVLETDSVRGSIRKRAVGMSMPSINTAILANTSFYQPPTLEEQRAIGEVFSNLDALIAAESHYITQLTQAKTALLQRMFV